MRQQERGVVHGRQLGQEEEAQFPRLIYIYTGGERLAVNFLLFYKESSE